MSMQLLPWIKDDVAIEIIGKMIAEQTQQLYKVTEEYKQRGFTFDSQEVMMDSRYQQSMKRIGDFKLEIDQIYDGNGLDELYTKVDTEYVPHLNRHPKRSFFKETKGFGFIETDNGEDIYVPASGNDLVQGEQTLSEPETRVKDHH